VATADNRVVERGSWTDEVQVVEVGGRRLLKRTWVLTRGGKVFDTINTLADPKTFAPVMTEERKHDGEFLYFDFAGTRLKGQRSSVPPGGQPRRIEAKLGTQFFDYYGGVYDLFLASLPLREGYAATFPAAMATFGPDADPADLDWVTIRVDRKEAVAADGGRKVEAWVVDCYNAFGFFKVWVVKEPPYVMKMMIVGPGGGRITYERTQPDAKAVPRL